VVVAATNVGLLSGVPSSGTPVAPVALADAVETGAEHVAHALGSPPTWPASWVFAGRHRLPPGQYDLLVGRYLFYRQNNLQGHVDLGSAGDAAMLGEGWGGRAVQDGIEARSFHGRARILAPLDVPEDIDVAVRARAGAPARVRLLVNGREAGVFTAAPVWETHRLAVRRDDWRQDLNDVVLETEGGTVWIDAVDFLRAGVPEGQERGFRAR